MRLAVRALIVAAVFAMGPLVVFSAEEAAASAAYDSPYTYEQTFGTALRLVRVDLGCVITEKDLDNGYLLFEYKSPESGNRVYRGSIEIIKRSRGAHVTVQLPALPQYHEQMIADSLVKKLATEHGEPPSPAPQPAPAPDGGSDDGGA